MKKIIYLIILLLFMQLASASTYKQEFFINENKVDSIININYENETRFNFYLDFPRDVEEIKVYLDYNEKKFLVRNAELNNFANIFGTSSNVRIEYNTNYYLESSSKYYFTADVNPVLNGNLEIKIVLPEGATLDKLYTEKDSGSVYPKPNKLETNGKNLIIAWNGNAELYKSFSIFLVYNHKTFDYYIFFPALIIILIIAYLIFKTVKKRKLKIKKIKIDNVERHLKDDEKLIFNILKRKKECSQATLVTLTNMSKASLSRLLDNLEERNIIVKESKGNKNIVRLKR